MNKDNQSGQDRNNQCQPQYEKLTSREQDILELVAEGIGNKEIAARLHLSEKTIRNRLSEIYSKLSVCNRTQAALWIQQQKLNVPEESDDNPNEK